MVGRTTVSVYRRLLREPCWSGYPFFPALLARLNIGLVGSPALSGSRKGLPARALLGHSRISGAGESVLRLVGCAQFTRCPSPARSTAIFSLYRVGVLVKWRACARGWEFS